MCTTSLSSRDPSIQIPNLKFPAEGAWGWRNGERKLYGCRALEKMIQQLRWKEVLPDFLDSEQVGKVKSPPWAFHFATSLFLKLSGLECICHFERLFSLRCHIPHGENQPVQVRFCFRTSTFFFQLILTHFSPQYCFSAFQTIFVSHTSPQLVQIRPIGQSFKARAGARRASVHRCHDHVRIQETDSEPGDLENLTFKNGEQM